MAKRKRPDSESETSDDDDEVKKEDLLQIGQYSSNRIA